MVALGGRGGIAHTHSWPRHYMEVSGQCHAPAALCSGERTPGTHCTGGWVGPRAGLDTEVRGKILCPCRGSNPDHSIVQSVVRHHTAWATRLLIINAYIQNILALPTLLYDSDNWTTKARDARRITAAEMKYTRTTAGYTLTDHKQNTQIAKELNMTPVLDKIQDYKKNWIQDVNRMPRNRLSRLTKN
jgi:hypothetical protein